MEATPPGAAISGACMSVSAGDIDGDGQLDMLLATGAGPVLLLGEPWGYVDATQSWGLPGTEGEQMAWGSAIADLDNDGLLDIPLPTSDFADLDVGICPAWAFRQVEEGTFEEVGVEIGLPRAAGTCAVLAHDINEDGILDIVMSDIHRGPWLFQSVGCSANSWLEVEAPDGAVVTVAAGSRTWTLPATSAVTGAAAFTAGAAALAEGADRPP